MSSAQVSMGADPDQLDSLGRSMDTAAEQLNQIRGRVGDVVAQLLWHGSDAAEFFEQWATRFSGSLGSAATMLQTAATHLATEANQQRETSADYGAGNGAGSSMPSVLDTLDRVDGGIGTVSTLMTIAELANYDNKLIDGVDLIDKADLAGAFDFADKGLGGIDLAINGIELAADLRDDPGSVRTADGVVDTLFSAAGLTAVVLGGGPVLGGAILLGSLTDKLIEDDFDPNINKQIVDVAVDAGKAVGEGVATGIKDDISAAKATASVLDTGARGAVSLIKKIPLPF